MKEIELLQELQDIELLSRKPAELKARAVELRALVPAPLLGHYDRLMARGKKGVAHVRNGVCGGCRMRLASGAHAQLLRDDDIVMCDNCARYLLATKDPEPEILPARKKAPAKRRKPRTADVAATIP
ncbi:MAG: hypothetical protein H7A45_11485 [Verrucomicrobiales bacterium]|nr:hypothetical protein [Verrucomicrobiales bacterium]MCP5526013.1 hypothetical protein [Verrucomicrobiales bacterium]